jgi:hypothetical protein
MKVGDKVRLARYPEVTGVVKAIMQEYAWVKFPFTPAVTDSTVVPIGEVEVVM